MKIADGDLVPVASVYVALVPLVGCLASMVEGEKRVGRLPVDVQRVVDCFF